VALVSEINKRVAKGKLTFRYAERPFKRGRWRLLDPRVLKQIWETYRLSNRKNYHLLSVGPYCAADYKFLGAFKARMWRWGYFPAITTNFKPKIKNSKPVVLWAGYLVAWKRVDLLLKAAAYTRTCGNGNFRLRIIGYGPEEENLRLLATQLGLNDICEFESPKNPEIIGDIMEASDIFVLTSDRNEGWGAVANESMSHGCCLIGSKSVGSVPWLIRDGLNGIMFEGGDPKKLGRILLNCLDNEAMRQKMGLLAQKTMIDLWTPEIAASRLLRLIEAIQKGETTPFQDEGPCSIV
jgi:glycosyltransferase involved in cell wall biosynthesis